MTENSVENHFEKIDFIKRGYKAIVNPRRSMDERSVDGRIQLIRKMEAIMRTDFKDTRDFKNKVEQFLGHGFDGRKLDVATKLIRTRKKAKLSQRELADVLGIKSHAIIAKVESGKRRPTRSIMKWLQEREKGGLGVQENGG